MKIGIVAGEPSGDALGASLIRAFHQKHPEATFVGIGGPLMQRAGCTSLYPIDTLSVMGFIAPLLRLPKILQCFYGLLRYFKENPPDIFVGLDSPDFNIRLEKKIKQRNIKTIHWVSPTLWAWRPGRIHAIKKAVSAMWVLFPFEVEIYQKHHIPVCFTGHPVADTVPLSITPLMRQEAAQALSLNPEYPILGLLPGSRKGEIAYLAPLFFETLRRLKQRIPHLQAVVPYVNVARQAQLLEIAREYPDCDIHFVNGQSSTVMLASGALLLASGTASLEAMLYKTPQVVAYKMGAPTYWLAKKLIRIPYVSLPNILAYTQGKPAWIPECLQNNATPEALTEYVVPLLTEPPSENFVKQCAFWHTVLQQNAGEKAAQALLYELRSS
jgi:lipid-A-disaccharide synthase